MMTEEYKEEYKKARKAAMKQYRTCASRGWSLYPPVLDEVSAYVKTAGEEVLGEMEIPLSLVTGTRTAGRQNAFSKDFLPILPENSEFARKWITLYEAQMEEGIRDPILVYEFMHQFYVQEGNKRVSVMKYLDASHIMAKVIRIFPEKTDEPSVKLYYEFIEFYRSTKFYDIVCKQVGNYAKLLKFMGKERNEACSDEERKKLQSLFYHFSSIYNAVAGNEEAVLTAGDAFLIYLNIFSYEEAASKPASKLREEILKMWKEFVPAKEAESVKRLLEPEEKKPAFWNKLLNSTQKLSIAFVYDKKPDTSSWLYAHELGRLHLEEVFPEKVETSCYIGDVEQAAVDGNQVIFTTTPLLMPESLKAALKYPEVQILNCSLNYAWKSIPTYYTRMYEVKFLTGLIAGSMAKGENIGYEADYPIYGSIANINAFALGVAMVNPNIKIYLNWTSEKGKPKAAVEELALVSARDMISADGCNRRFGLYSNENGEILNIATSVLDWGIFYEKIIQQMLDGTWKKVSDKETASRNYWWGLSAGVENLICSSQMPYGTKRLVDTFQSLITEGHFHPFEGMFYDKNGREHGKKNTILSNEEIITMDWLFANIVGEIPEKYELKEQAKPIVELQGVKGDEYPCNCRRRSTIFMGLLSSGKIEGCRFDFILRRFKSEISFLSGNLL